MCQCFLRLILVVLVIYSTDHVRTHCSKADERVVIDGTCTTSRGPGTAFEFALALVEQLCGKSEREHVAGPMVMYKHCD
jgi:transcriptional regulator GlxA family with amidase domain